MPAHASSVSESPSEIGKSERPGSPALRWSCNGSVTENIEPFPYSLSTCTVPPSGSRSFRVMLRPSPVPPNSRVRD